MPNCFCGKTSLTFLIASVLVAPRTCWWRDLQTFQSISWTLFSLKHSSMNRLEGYRQSTIITGMCIRISQTFYEAPLASCIVSEYPRLSRRPPATCIVKLGWRLLIVAICKIVTSAVLMFAKVLQYLAYLQDEQCVLEQH